MGRFPARRARVLDMEHSATPADFERLFEHQEWVRALALRLSGDGAAADDLVQETWIEALRTRAVAESPRAWLGGIVRNLARRARKRDRARSLREIGAAREEGLPSASDLLARAELQRRVLAAVGTLDEAQRVVVLLRYAEGLRAEEIARRLGVPGSTVRNRLARSLERLRARLDADYGDRGAWAALFVPSVGAPAASTALTIGGGIVKAQLAIAGTLVVIATAVWWPRSEGAEGAAAPLVATAAPDRAARAAAAEFSPASVSTSATGVAREVAAPVERVLVSGRVLGASTLDLGQPSARFTGADGIARAADVRAGGEYTVFGLSPGSVRVRIDVRGFIPLDEEFELPADRERARRDFTLQRALVLPVRFTDLEGSVLELPREVAELLAAVATRVQPGTAPGIRGRRPAGFGAGTWRPEERHSPDPRIPAGCAGVLEIREPAPVWISAVLREAVLASRLVRGDEPEIVFALDRELVLGQLGSVALHVVDGRTGAPLADASVELSFRDASGADQQVDALGDVLLENVVPGLRTAWTRAAGRADVRLAVRVPAGERIDLGTVALYPVARMRGRLVDVDGRGVSGIIDTIPTRLLARPRALESVSIERSAADGTFSLEQCEAGPVRIVAYGEALAATAIEVDASSGGLDGIEIQLVPGTPVELRAPKGNDEVAVEVVDVAGRPLRALIVHPSWPTRIRLASGSYTLHVIRDDRVVRSEVLEVGRKPVVHEVAGP